MKFKIVYNCKWMFWAAGMVVWPFMFFKRSPSEVSNVLYRHELEHCYQVKREGRLKFYATYLWYQIRYGYKKNPYEVEANEREFDALTEQEKQWRGKGVIEL
jgi:hypothetical protein